MNFRPWVWLVIPASPQALAYIHENYHLAPSLSDVARAVSVSPFHFHRLFTAQVGVSPKHYLQGRQLQMARWLLGRGSVPIGTIAQRTGFSSHGHFTSTFSPGGRPEPHRLPRAAPSLISPFQVSSPGMPVFAAVSRSAWSPPFGNPARRSANPAASAIVCCCACR